MSLRIKFTVRFTIIVTAILLITMGTIYSFTNYFFRENFYRRLNNRAKTIVVWMSQAQDNEHDIHFFEKLMDSRKDEMPSEEVLIYDANHTILFSLNEQKAIVIDKNRLNEIERNSEISFFYNNFQIVGLSYHKNQGHFIVIAAAKDAYGNYFLTQMRWMMIGLTIISIFLISIIGWINAKLSLKPIDRIGIELNKIFPKNLKQRLPVIEADAEIGRLINIVNQLLGRIEQGFQEHKLFLGNISHELQNPLTSISSQLEVCLFNDRTENQYKKTVASVLEDVVDLITLTQNILNLSYSDAETDSLVEKIMIDELVLDVRDDLLSANPSYRIEISLKALPNNLEALSIFGNYALLKSAFLNLVENSCKFSFNNHAIIEVSVNENEKKIKFIDYGIGINKEELQLIFQPFYRSDRTSKTKGYGLGLPLTEKIIKMHKGVISVDSQIGKGATFTIIFP